MPHVYRSVGSGKVYPVDHVLKWGRTLESDGYGPRPCCTALIPNEYAPKAPDGATPLQVCGSQLVAESITDAALGRERELGNLVEIHPR